MYSTSIEISILVMISMTFGWVWGERSAIPHLGIFQVTKSVGELDGIVTQNKTGLDVLKTGGEVGRWR